MLPEKILAALAAFDTVKDRENRKIMAWISAYLKKSGFKIVQNAEPGGKRINLIAFRGTINEAKVFFCGHTDTVAPGEGWLTDPFELTRKNGRCYGLGASDMKGGIAAMLAAATSREMNKSRNVGFIFTYDEEILFSGIRNLQKKFKFRNKLFIIGEPTELKPVISTKGILAFTIDFIGKSAHGSQPDRGINAIEKACDFIARLKKAMPAVTRLKNTAFDPAEATMNIGKISGGDYVNKVPAACRLEIEFRLINYKQEKIITTLVNSVLKTGKDKAEIVKRLYLPPMQENGVVIPDNLKKVIGRHTYAVNYGTEGAFLGDNRVIILGPGSIKQAHAANEFVGVEQLEKAVLMYRRIVKVSG